MDRGGEASTGVAGEVLFKKKLSMSSGNVTLSVIVAGLMTGEKVLEPKSLGHANAGETGGVSPQGEDSLTRLQMRLTMQEME